MSTNLSRVSIFFCMLAVGWVSSGSIARGQSLYVVRKSELSLQTSGSVTATGFSAMFALPPSGRFVFTAQAASAATLTLPSNSTQILSVGPTGGIFEINQSFGTRTALDAAFPNGTYGMSGASFSPLTFNLAGDSYPTAVQAVAWNDWNNGLMVISPDQSNVLGFAANTGYGTTGVGSHMSLKITGLMDNVNLKAEIWSRAVFEFPATPARFTSFTIPSVLLRK